MPGRHLADHRAPSAGGRLKHFLRLARTPREGWHRPHARSGASRLLNFLRIARGKST